MSEVKQQIFCAADGLRGGMQEIRGLHKGKGSYKLGLCASLVVKLIGFLLKDHHVHVSKLVSRSSPFLKHIHDDPSRTEQARSLVLTAKK